MGRRRWEGWYGGSMGRDGEEMGRGWEGGDGKEEMGGDGVQLRQVQCSCVDIHVTLCTHNIKCIHAFPFH